jgi:L-ribulose-5-phosphate 4-epimerase
MAETKVRALAEDVYKANKALVENGLVISTFGNVSGIDRGEAVIAIKPSGVEYSALSPENMVLLNLKGKKIRGDMNPSSDSRAHAALYAAFPDIGGVVHTHSKYATAWAQARRPLPCLGTTHADCFHGPVPCTRVITDEQIKRDYEEETAAQIVEAFRRLDYRSLPAVLVASHGPFSWGKDAAEAVHNSFILEYVAEMAFISLGVNPGAKGIKRTLLDKHFLRKHGSSAYYGQRT